MKKRDHITSQIKAFLADYFQAYWPMSVMGGLVTVTEVIPSPKGDHLWVFLSIMATAQGLDPSQMLAAIREKKWHAKHYLSNVMRNRLRLQPDFDFKLDTGASRAIHMERIFQQLPLVITEEADENGSQTGSQ